MAFPLSFTIIPCVGLSRTQARKSLDTVTSARSLSFLRAQPDRPAILLRNRLHRSVLGKMYPARRRRTCPARADDHKEASKQIILALETSFPRLHS